MSFANYVSMGPLRLGLEDADYVHDNHPVQHLWVMIRIQGEQAAMVGRCKNYCSLGRLSVGA